VTSQEIPPTPGQVRVHRKKLSRESSYSAERAYFVTEFAGNGRGTVPDDFVKTPDQRGAMVFLEAGKGEESCKCRPGLTGDQMLDLACVGFSDIGINTKDVNQERKNDASFRKNPGHEFFTRAAEPETVVLSDINEPVVLQCPQLNRYGSTGDIESAGNIGGTGRLFSTTGIPDRQQVMRHGMTDFIGLEFFPDALQITHGEILHPPGPQSQIGLMVVGWIRFRNRRKRIEEDRR